jgi:hypothetical protein
VTPTLATPTTTTGFGAHEDLLARKGIGSAETARWRDGWQHAANRTPHGKPIELQADDFDAAPNTGAYPQ